MFLAVQHPAQSTQKADDGQYNGRNIHSHNELLSLRNFEADTGGRPQNSLLSRKLLSYKLYSLLHISAAFSTTGVSALGVGAAGYAGAHSILDGDSLHSGSCRERDGLLILQALVGRRAAINGVDLEPLR